ncbi:hypothetical protein ACFL3T_04650 [Patescibacteria group bacterium]
MLKKLITIGILTVIIVLTMPLTQAQRAIDPLLKPDNAPGVPLTGPAQLECLKKYSDKDTALKKIYDKVKDDITKKIKTISDEEKKTVAKYWDNNSQMCRGNEEEPVTAFIQIIAGALLMISGGIAVIIMTIGGVMYVTSRGNQQQLEFAKNTLLYGILGMLVMIFAYYIVQFVIALIVGG